MSKRNSQNPIRKEMSFKKERSPFAGGAAHQPGKTPGTMACPSCGADVPPKPGFRMQSLKCPECGASMRQAKGSKKTALPKHEENKAEPSTKDTKKSNKE